MPQDTQTGAQANTYGRKTAKTLASKVGAVAVSDSSNEFAYKGKLITIRCAHMETTDVGVTYNMLDRIDLIVGAFEIKEGKYLLISMTPSLYRLQLRDSKKEGKVGLVSKKSFEELGKTIQYVCIK